MNAVAGSRVIVIGGGLAGLAGAVALAEAGMTVTLYERRPVLGGRASSFVHPASGELVDNCQHVLLRCCTNLLHFYETLGVAGGVVFKDRIPFIDEQNTLSVLSAAGLPAPFHLLPSFLRLNSLGWKDKLSVGYTIAQMIRHTRRTLALSPFQGRVAARPYDFAFSRARHVAPLQALPPSALSMLSWLRAHRATGRAIEAFWRPFLISALNDDLDDIAADYGIMTVVRAFLLNRHGYEVGLPTVPLRDLYTPCIAHLNRFGGCVELDRGAAGFSVSGNRITSVTLTDGTAATADVYLSAVPFDVLLKLLPDKEIAQSAYFGDLRRLEVSPITAVHVWFDRPVTDLAYVAVLGRTIQWVFNLGVRAPDGAGPSGAALGLVVSASDAWMRRPQQEIVQEALEDLRALFPAVREAGLLKTVVVKEGRATFAPRPGCDAWRPGPVSPIANLFVAGDWTQTGWPATMESAVRSGYQSAEAILEAAGKPGRILQPDLAVEGLMRWALGIKT